MSTEPTGTDYIREATFAREKRLVGLARDVGIGPNILDSFMRGDADLPTPILEALTLEIWNGAMLFDAAANRLIAAPAPPAQSLGTPPPYRRIEPLPFTAGPSQRGGPQPEVKPPPKKSKPGWIGVWE